MNQLMRTAITLTATACVLLAKPALCAEQQTAPANGGQPIAAAPSVVPSAELGNEGAANPNPGEPARVPPAENQTAASSVAASPYGPAKSESKPASEPVPQPSKRAYDGPPTLLDSADYAIGGFGGVGVMYTRFAGSGAPQVCGEGGVIIDHALDLGGGGCGITTTVDAFAPKYGPSPNYPGDRMGFGYGGAIIRYHFLTRKIVNVGVGALIGAGGLTIGAWDSENHEWSSAHQRSEAVFVFEPQVGAYTNFTRWLRFGATLGYRIVAGVDMQNVSASDLSAVTLGGVVQGGWF